MVNKVQIKIITVFLRTVTVNNYLGSILRKKKHYTQSMCNVDGIGTRISVYINLGTGNANSIIVLLCCGCCFVVVGFALFMLRF